MPSRRAAATRQSSQLQSAVERIRALEDEIGRVIRDTQEKVLQFEYLNELSRLLNSTLDTDIVREKALEATCKLLACETASLFLVDPETSELYWETALGDAGKKLQKSIRLPINDRSIAGYVAMTGETLVVNDVENDPRYFRKAKDKSGFRTRTMICAPLRARDRVIGVLQAINKLPSTRERIEGGGRIHSWADFREQDRRLMATLSHQVAIAVENSLLYGELKRSFFETVQALSEAIEKKDRYTGGHTKRVVHYSVAIGKQLRLGTDQIERLRMSAILHDVGKIGVEDKILKKQAELDPYEWPYMKKHPELGFEIMRKVSGLKDVIGGIRFHHERWDGSGYPLGFRGEEIPLLARIIALADAFDAMVSTRPYRRGIPPREAFDEIVRNRGTQFDPEVVDAFIAAFQRDFKESPEEPPQ